MARLLLGFVAEFFDQNPLGQLGLIVTSDGKAQLVTPLSGKTIILAVFILRY